MFEQLWANLEKWRAEGSQEQIVAAIRELALDERGYELQMELVWALERLNDFDGAIDELLRAKAEGEHDPQWHYLLGCSYFALEQYDLAMKAYEQALLLDSTDERTWRLLDHCCRQMGETSPLYQQLGRVYGGAFHPVSYEAEALAAVKRHIRRYFGDAAMTIQEAASEEIGLEIQIIQPTLRRPFYTLVTVGMGAFRMQVPELFKASKLERAELLICLPMDWQVNNPLPQWHWPIGWLKALAALPAQEGGWLAWGHTVPNDGPIAEGTALCGMILSSPCALPKEAAVCALPDGGEVNFYQLIPLYEEELRFKRERGAEALFGRFDDQVDHVVDIYRPNACAVLINKQWAIPAEAIKPLLSGWQGPDGALATDRIVVDGQPVGYMYREAPEEDATDSGWRFLAGDESEEYIADYDHFGIYRLNTLCNYDPDILPYLHAPYGTAYYRDENGVFQQEIKRPPTFRARVQAFWQWFEQQEEALVQMIDVGDSEAWQQLMAAGTLLITEELPCYLLDKRAIVWPADMCPWRFYLLPYLLAAAPERVRLHWQLYAGRPALEAGDDARLEGVLAALSGEGAADMLSLRLYHPAWQEMEELAAYEEAYQLVDAAVGEERAYIYIADVEIVPQPEEGMLPLSQLGARLEQHLQALGLASVQRVSQFKRPYERLPQKRDTMRYDVFWGESCYLELVNSYYNGIEEGAEALADCGAQAVYLFFAHGGMLITEALHELLSELEGRLQAIISPYGLVLGCALGEDCGYLDLLLFDLPGFLTATEQILKAYPYQFYLAELKLDGRIALLER